MIRALRRRAARSVLGIRDFRLLWTGQTISIAGDMIFPVAITLAIIEAGGSAGAVGLVLAARWLALVLFVILGGVWADRLPRRTVMMASDAFRAFVVLAIAGYPGVAPVWVLASLVFLVGGGEAFFRPAYGALIPAILPEERRAAANAMTSVSLRSGAIVGPALGAILVTLTSVRIALLVDALTFVVSLATLALLREPPYEPGPRQALLGEVRDGFREVLIRPWIAAVLAVAALQLFFVVAPQTVLLPFVSRDEFGGNSVYAAALSLLSAGGLLGALIAMRWSPRSPGLVSVAGLGLFTLVPLALLAPFADWWVLAAYFVAGVGVEPFMVYWAVALQREIPPDKLARVTSIDWLCSMALLPLGLAVSGPAADAFGRSSVLAVSVAIMVVTTFGLLFVPGMKDFRTPMRQRQRTGIASPSDVRTVQAVD